MDAPRALVFRPLVKGDEALGQHGLLFELTIIVNCEVPLNRLVSNCAETKEQSRGSGE